MRPCTVVLRRQLPAALRLGDQWAALHPHDPWPLLVLVADGTEQDRSLTPTARVVDAASAGLSPQAATLLRLLHPATDIVMAFGPWAVRAALDSTDATARALLLDPRAMPDQAATVALGGVGRLARSHGLVVSTGPGFVAADRSSTMAWGRRALSAMTPAELRRALISDDHALVVPTTLTLSQGGLLPNDDLAWRAQRDGTIVPAALRGITIGWLAAHLDRTEPEWAPSAGGAALRFESLARDLLAGTPRDLRSGTTERAPASVPAPPPDPFGPDPAAYRAWLGAAVTPEPFAVSRALAEIHRYRPDLHETFCDLDHEDSRRGLLEWCAGFGRAEGDLPGWLIAPPPGPPPTSPNLAVSGPPRAQGVLVAGYLDAALGLGEAARLVVRAAERAGERVGTLTYRHLISPGVDWCDRTLPGGTAADVHVLCLNGAALPRFVRSVGPRFSQGSHVVGLWFWETEQLTPAMRAGFDHVDEIWTASDYAASAIRADAPPGCEVHVMALGVDIPPVRVDAAVARLQLGLPAGWLAGFSFDHGSMRERKNPIGLIEAWRSAFPVPITGDDAPRLVLKTMNAASHPQSSAAVAQAAADRPDVTIIDSTWTPAQQHLLIAALDCYASLHRAEGYGLLLLEAMAVGTPVLATGATGNLAFMTAQNSWLVPARRITMEQAFGPYDAGSVVQEPDGEAAAALLRQLYGQRRSDEVRARVAQARADTRALADGSAAEDWVRRRLAAIRAGRRQR